MHDFPIEWNASKENQYSNCKFSIIIPSWNNLEMLKCCINSIKKNSKYQHQIIIHINQGSDGTLEWVKANGYDYTFSQSNVGICWANNACRYLVKTDYITYLNDDMYVLPDWDFELWKAIERLPDNRFFLSATIIEPLKSSSTEIISPCDYGNTPSTFNEEKLLKEYKELPSYEWSGATWPPNVVHTQIWDLIGGYSIEYFPGMYSDPDFSMKLLKAGVRHFRGISTSRVYHFGSKSTLRVKKNSGSKQFLNKWGITSSTLSKYFLRKGEAFNGDIVIDIDNTRYKIAKLKCRFKRFISSLSSTGQVDEL